MIATERERGDVALARWLWHRGQGSVDPRKLVFVDETGTATNMAPLYGWGPKSERLVGSASHGHWRRTTFVGGLTLDGFIAPLVIEQAMNAAIFQAWIEQSLIPDMPKGAIVVMDNEPAYQGGHFWKPITPIRGQYSTPIHIFEGRFAVFDPIVVEARTKDFDAGANGIAVEKDDLRHGNSSEFATPSEKDRRLQEAAIRRGGTATLAYSAATRIALISEPV